MRGKILCLVFGLLSCNGAHGFGIYRLGDELILNGNMENNNWDKDYHWFPIRATATHDVGVQGNAAAITPEVDKDGVFGQDLLGERALTAGYYYMEGFVKVLNHPGGNPWSRINLRFRYADASSAWKSVTIAEYFRIRDTDGWVKISGEFTVPANASSQRVFFQSSLSPNLRYAVDEVSLKQIIPDDDWEAAANEMIHEHRKGEVNVNLNINYNLDPSYVTVKIKQLNHDFKLGAHIYSQVFNGSWDTEEIREAYRDYFDKNFKSATPTTRFKWPNTEKTEGVLEFDHIDKAIASLKERGADVIGSDVFWDNENNGFPSWAKDRSYSETIDLMKKRVTDVVEHFNGTVNTYIVCRDNLRHGNIQQMTGDYEIVGKMFDWMEATNAQANLVLSDQNVIRSSERTSALAHQALTLKNAGHNLQIGAQGIFESKHTIDPIRLMARFEILAQANLPILVTRLNVQRTDVLERAKDLDTFLRVAYAHPNVESITFEGFWPGRMVRPDTGLVDLDFEMSNVSWALNRLFKKEWRTDAILTFDEKYVPQQTTNFRVFYGDYEMHVMVDDEVVETRPFSVRKGVPTNIAIDINEPSTA